MNTNGNGQTQTSINRQLDIGKLPWWKRPFWEHKNFKTIAIMGAGIALLGVRQFNTVPDRYFASGQYEIRKVDDLTGSAYHLYKTERLGGKYTEEISKDEQIPGMEYEQFGEKHHYMNMVHIIIKPREEIFEDVTTDIGQSKVFNDLATMTGNWHVR